MLTVDTNAAETDLYAALRAQTPLVQRRHQTSATSSSPTPMAHLGFCSNGKPVGIGNKA